MFPAYVSPQNLPAICLPKGEMSVPIVPRTLVIVVEQGPKARERFEFTSNLC